MRDRHITLGEARQFVQEGLRIARDCRVEAIMKENNTIRSDPSRIVR